MKILILYRTKEDDVGEFVLDLKKALEEKDHKVDIISRNEDLNLPGLSSSMDGLPRAVEKMDKENNYDLIYTQDWSIAFPLVFPKKTLFGKHYCLFHGQEEMGGTQSKILQKIAGNLMGDHLLVKSEDLSKKFPKANFVPDGMSKEIFG